MMNNEVRSKAMLTSYQQQQEPVNVYRRSAAVRQPATHRTTNRPTPQHRLSKARSTRPRATHGVNQSQRRHLPTTVCIHYIFIDYFWRCYMPYCDDGSFDAFLENSAFHPSWVGKSSKVLSGCG